MSSPPSASAEPIVGLRVLVVEDEAAISLLIEDMLLEFGCEVVGPAGRLSAAMSLVETERLDLAILDVNVAGEPVYPVADALVQKGVRIVFSTGYGAGALEERYRDRTVLQKPFSQKELERALMAAAS